MEDVASVITATCSSIKEAIERNQMGRTKNVSKDFLSPASTDTRICRKVNAWKRKCSAIKLSVLSDDLRSEIKRSELLFTSLFLLSYSYYTVTCQDRDETPAGVTGVQPDEEDVPLTHPAGAGIHSDEEGVPLTHLAGTGVHSDEEDVPLTHSAGTGVHSDEEGVPLTHSAGAGVHSDEEGVPLTHLAGTGVHSDEEDVPSPTQLAQESIQVKKTSPLPTQLAQVSIQMKMSPHPPSWRRCPFR